MRAETRAYLIDIRRRRATSGAAEPPAEADPPLAEHAAAAGILPHPHIAALSPPAQQAEAAASEPAPAPAKPVLKELPLGALRLLGQGMIWRLNNLGIRTLDDLAACNPAKLGESLGPIGRLLRTDVWVQAAREIIAQG